MALLHTKSIGKAKTGDGIKEENESIISIWRTIKIWMGDISGWSVWLV